MVAKKRTILIVDDEINLVQMVTDILEAEDFKVLPAYNADECLATLKKQKVDLILLDLMMPKVDGWMLHRKIKESKDWKDIPIIILTAKTDALDKNVGIEIAKVSAYLTKPFVPQDLVNKINEIFNK
jgi:DNA-binding response OmpR family regulator